MKKVLSACLILLSTASVALEKGDKTFHMRVINVAPNDSSSMIMINDVAAGGTGVSVDNGYSIDFSFGYAFADNWSVELLTDLSSEHDVYSRGLSSFGLSDDIKVIDANVLPPTLLIKRSFNSRSKFQPYIGAGINYTLFLNEKLSHQAKSSLGASNLDIDRSTGLAAQVGFDWKLKNNWFFNVDVKYIEIDSTASFDTAAGKASVKFDVNPTVFGVGFGKRF